MTLDFNDGKFPNKENVSPDINIGKSFVIAFVGHYFIILNIWLFLNLTIDSFVLFSPVILETIRLKDKSSKAEQGLLYSVSLEYLGKLIRKS